jgi:hypothetical protein
MLDSLLFIFKKKKRRRFGIFSWKKNENKNRVQSNRRFGETAGSPVLSVSHRSNCMANPTFKPDRSPLQFAVWPIRLTGSVWFLKHRLSHYEVILQINKELNIDRSYCERLLIYVRSNFEWTIICIFMMHEII